MPLGLLPKAAQSKSVQEKFDRTVGCLVARLVEQLHWSDRQFLCLSVLLSVRPSVHLLKGTLIGQVVARLLGLSISFNAPNASLSVYLSFFPSVRQSVRLFVFIRLNLVNLGGCEAVLQIE